MTKDQAEENYEETLPPWERLALHASRLSRAAENLRRAARMIQSGNEITTRLLDENKQLRQEIARLSK